MGAATDAVLAELPALQRMALRALLGSLTPAEQGRVELAISHVIHQKAIGDPRDFLAILREYLDGEAT